MNLYRKITSIFLPLVGKMPHKEDKFSVYEIKYIISNFRDFNFDNLNSFLSMIPEFETWTLNIKIGNSDSIKLDKVNFKEFKESIDSEREIFEEEEVQVMFQIRKKTENCIYVYDFKSFCELWDKSSIVNILNLIKKYQNPFLKLNFILHEKEIEPFYSNGISFTHSKDDHEESYIKNCISDNCHFGNIEEFPFDAYFFNPILRPQFNNKIVEVLDKLSLTYSIISIFDITSISENTLYYKLNGYKSYNGKLTFSDVSIELSSLYFKIFDWVYCEKSNISDKIGLVRNIISLSIQEDSIQISDSVYLSIQSGYKTYLQENISKYIELRNKIIDELSWISNKSGEIASGHLSNYQKSIFTFLSFFISVFILRFLKGGDTEAVFTKEVTLFSLSFLILSVLFLYFSHWNMKVEKTRLERKYKNIKNRYTDLLDKNDIERILKEDAEFNYELSYINKLKSGYTTLWVLTIVVLISTILCVSDYLNWNIIFEFLCKKLTMPAATNV